VLFLGVLDAQGRRVLQLAGEAQLAAQDFVRRSTQEHCREFVAFELSPDVLHPTNSDLNQRLMGEVFESLAHKGYLVEREVTLPFCPRCRQYGFPRSAGGVSEYDDEADCGDGEADRPYIVGEGGPGCPTCRASLTCRHVPHLFIRVDGCPASSARLEELVSPRFAQGTGLPDWDITREGSYFGFEVPGRRGQYLCRDLGVLSGYLAATQVLCTQRGVPFDTYWRSEETELQHFTDARDVTRQGIRGTRTLTAAGLRLPTYLFSYGSLSVSGSAPSRPSRPLSTAAYRKHLDPQYLRYSLAARLTRQVSDVVLTSDDFVAEGQRELVNGIVAIPRWVMRAAEKCGGRLGHMDGAGRGLVEHVRGGCERVAQAYEERDFAQVVRKVNGFAKQINAYLADRSPTRLAGMDPVAATAVCAGALSAYKMLATVLQPILPRFGTNLAQALGQRSLTWAGLDESLEEQPVAPYEARLAAR